MSTLQNLTNIVTSLVGKLNRIETNSKKTEELPSQTTLDPATLLRGSRDGVSEKLSVQQIINAIENGNYNQLISVNGISVVEEGGDYEIIVESGVVWTINNIIYQTTSEKVIPTTLSATGTNRIDILVGNTSNEIILISGEETEGIAVAPATPFDTVFITQINVTDGSVGTPTDPLVGTQFKKKIESSAFTYGSLSGQKAVIQLRPQGNSFYAITGAGLVSIDGFGLDLITGNPSAEPPYAGKELFIQNIGSQPFDLLHDGDGMATVKFRFFNEQNLTVPPQGVVLLKYFIPYCEVVSKSWSDASASQVYKTITGNTTLENSFNGAIVKIKATATITIPDGLTSDFNCVFRTYSGVTATFAVSGTATIDAESDGTTLNESKMCSLFVDGTNNYILSGTE